MMCKVMDDVCYACSELVSLSYQALTNALDPGRYSVWLGICLSLRMPWTYHAQPPSSKNATPRTSSRCSGVVIGKGIYDVWYTAALLVVYHYHTRINVLDPGRYSVWLGVCLRMPWTVHRPQWQQKSHTRYDIIRCFRVDTDTMPCIT